MLNWADRFEHVIGILDESRAFADQLIAALRARIERRARNRHHFAPELGGVARSDQRARSGGGFNDDGAVAKAGNDAVAIRKVPRARLRCRRLFRDQQSAVGNGALPRFVSGG